MDGGGICLGEAIEMQVLGLSGLYNDNIIGICKSIELLLLPR